MSDKYYMLKRDLYECPDHQGYTGIRDKAGIYHAGQAARADSIGNKYVKGFMGHYAIPVECAPEFTAACFDDLARDHLKQKCAASDDTIKALTEALETLSHIHDGNPSDAMAGMSDLDYARHMLFEVRKFARETLSDLTVKDERT